LGIVLGASVCLLIFTGHKTNDPSLEPSSKLPAWNASDYLSNSDYYKQLIDMHDITEIDNLRLDYLSSPRFHPINGKSVVYLRRQFHMPDLQGISTTLHWIDLKTNKSVQLTRPIWDINDRQVRLF
jgi:hypothetical protein